MRFRPNLGLPGDGRWLFWGMFAWEFGFGLFNLLLTIYMEELGASGLQIGILIGVQGIARVAVTLPAGILAERFSRRGVIMWTTAATVPAALLYAVAQTWWHLIPGLVLMMIGNLGTPSFGSYISEISTPRNRARYFALIYTVAPATATIISPTLGGFIAEQISMRAMFVAGAIAYAVSTYFMSRLSDRPLSHHLSSGPKPSYRETIAVPAIRNVGLLKFGVLFVLALGVTFLPNYLEDVHGFSIGTIGRLGSVYALGSVLMSLFISRVVWMTGSRGVALATMSVGLLCGVTLATGNPWVLTPAFLLRGGFMVAWSLIASVLGDISPERLRGRAFALADFMGGIGFGIAPFVAGAMYDWNKSVPLLACFVLTPLLGVAALQIERRYVRPAMAERLAESTRALEPAVVPEGAATA